MLPKSVFKLLAMAGKAGRYMSIAKGPNAVSNPISTNQEENRLVTNVRERVACEKVGSGWETTVGQVGALAKQA